MEPLNLSKLRLAGHCVSNAAFWTTESDPSVARSYAISALLELAGALGVEPDDCDRIFKMACAAEEPAPIAYAKGRLREIRGGAERR